MAAANTREEYYKKAYQEHTEREVLNAQQRRDDLAQAEDWFALIASDVDSDYCMCKETDDHYAYCFDHDPNPDKHYLDSSDIYDYSPTTVHKQKPQSAEEKEKTAEIRKKHRESAALIDSYMRVTPKIRFGTGTRTYAHVPDTFVVAQPCVAGYMGTTVGTWVPENSGNSIVGDANDAASKSEYDVLTKSSLDEDGD